VIGSSFMTLLLRFDYDARTSELLTARGTSTGTNHAAGYK